MIKRTWLYQRLRNFRAGIEGVISFLKRCFGWDRCAWRTYDSFRTYTWGLCARREPRDDRAPLADLTVVELGPMNPRPRAPLAA